MLTMYDSIFPWLLSGLPNTNALAGYVDGRWQTFSQLPAIAPGAKLLSIAVFPEDDADILDVENGDATIAEIFAWQVRQQKRGAWRPGPYSSVLNIDHIVATMAANGFSRASYRLWSAHYGAAEHICGPASCGLCGTACDGTQWTDNAFGLSVDQSLLLDSFFPSPPAPPPPPRITPKEAEMFYLPTIETGIPVALDSNVRRLRFFSNGDTAVRIDWVLTPDAPSVDLTLSYSAGAQGVTPPPGCMAAVVHRHDPDPSAPPLIACHLVY